MNTSNFQKTEAYFAAANGYYGFVSYFTELFDPYSFEKLYILKGGPGTGKSSLMKGVASKIRDAAERIELIYCASDKSSLDGIIAYVNGKKYGIIDGTAPHSQDPIYPGATDEIINLGAFWDEGKLYECRNDIKAFTKEKNRAYECAYSYLRICKEISGAITELLESESKTDTSSLITSLNGLSLSGPKETRILTSFGKGGFFKLDTLNRKAYKTVNIVGVYGSEYILTNRISDLLRLKGIAHIYAPSALDPKNTYALYINEIDTLYICGELEGEIAEETIDSSVFVKEALNKNKTRLEFLAREKESFLWAASDEFKKASDAHFKLEKIYSAAMNFDKHEKIASEISSRIMQ
ncbi:MAG: hypothetical protein J6Q69_07355 [Clostridia bacterium]|nr:hypothetical protein [Clostridia bacterium]